MFDVGFTELVLLAVIGLVVLGPQRLPKVAGEIGARLLFPQQAVAEDAAA